MSISVNSASVNRGTVDPSQNKANKAKSKADEEKTIQSAKKSSHAKTDSKDHKKLLKSLYVSSDETVKNFGLAGKSLLGSRPVLAPWEETTDTTHAKGFEDNSKESSAKDEPQSTNKSSSKNPSSSVATSKSSKKNLEEKSNTSSKVAQNQSKTNINKNNKTSTVAKSSHSKTINSEAKIAKASSAVINTQQEMDEFIDKLTQGVKDFQEAMGTKKSKSLNTKDTLKGKSKDSKSASSTSLFSGDNSSLANKSEPQGANKAYSASMSGNNKLQHTKAKNFSSDGSEISDDQTDSKDNTSHLDKNIPAHILNARKHSMALKGSISNIVSNASLQSLIARYLDTRGSYSIKIMIEMEKLKTGKGKTTTADLTDAQKSRGLASDRQILEIKKADKKQKEAQKMAKAMGIIGIITAALAVIFAVVALVATGGTAGPLLVVALVGLFVGITALIITSVNSSTITVEGRTMGRFNACIYKSFRARGVDPQEAIKDAQYTSIGIQAGLVVVSMGASIAGGAVAGEQLVALLNKITTKLASKFENLSYFAEYGSRIASFLTQLGDASAAEAEYTVSGIQKTIQLAQGTGGLTEACLGGYKTKLDYDATTLQAKVTEIQAMFENIEQNEHIAQMLLQKSIKRIAESAGSVMKTLDAEYQAIKMLNMRSKIA